MRRYLEKTDPGWIVFICLLIYLVLGMTILGFNRTPDQVGLMMVMCGSLELLLSLIFRKKAIFPLSALITSCSLSILLNYSHSWHLLFVPVFFAIGSKYVFTFQGKHVFNPALFGITSSILLSNDLLTASPAYQWRGIPAMIIFIIMPAILFILPNIRRTALILSFVATFTLASALRALIMQHHLPFETIFLGSVTTPAFFLFSFFMITDPKTSPDKVSSQIVFGAAIAVLDLAFHLIKSYHTIFWAGMTVMGIRFMGLHIHSWLTLRKPSFLPLSRFSLLSRLSLVLLAVFIRQNLLSKPQRERDESQITSTLRYRKISEKTHKIAPEFGKILHKVDPRVAHIAKWLLSVGDAVATADYDEDGFEDLFFTFMLKSPRDRASLYRNTGNFRFERVVLPALSERVKNPLRGLPTTPIFSDYDNDGDFDLFIGFAFGSPVLLKNTLKESGQARFIDVSEESGLASLYTNSVAANFADLNRDGIPDLIIGNVLPSHLKGYKHQQKLNIFRLPEPEFQGDRRMFRFMHESWHKAQNGGMNVILTGSKSGRFTKLPHTLTGIDETRWTLSVATADFNQDGWTDIYFANDFGPDRLYYNHQGKVFESIKGNLFGSVGNDTYKGMNASTGDLDRNGTQDLYISNVHHALQAEGSLLWTFHPDQKRPFYPEVRDLATASGALNEHRFGWGGAIADLNRDGWQDIVQANGMTNDSVDKRFEKCPDYWYINEKLVRTGPEIHSYADQWGDIRGTCIFGNEADRIYLNLGKKNHLSFIDVAAAAGLSSAKPTRGVAVADFDNNGLPDLVITAMYDPPEIYQNVSDNPMHWSGLTLRGSGTSCSKEALGSVVTLTDSHNIIQVQEVTSVNGFHAQSGRRLFFGLGNASGPYTVEVNWCLKKRKIYRNLRPDRYYELFEKNPVHLSGP